MAKEIEKVNSEIVEETTKTQELDINASGETTDEVNVITDEEPIDDTIGMMPHYTDEDILRGIAEHGGHIGTEEKRLIRELSTKYGLYFRPLTRCSTCYMEQALKIYAVIKDKKKTKSGTIDGYQLREGLKVIYRNHLICEETLTKENAERWIADGFPLKYFVKVPKETK